MAEPTPDLKKAFEQASPELNSQLVKARNMLMEATDQRPEFKPKDNPSPNEQLRSLVVESKKIDGPANTPNSPSPSAAKTPSRSR